MTEDILYRSQGKETMIWTAENIPDQDGRIALVTGANSGLGFETSKALLQKGAIVIMGCRSLIKAQRARKALLQTIDSGDIELIQLDLSDLEEVNRTAEELRKKYEKLDLLINNAGLMAPPLTLSKQGLEIQFAVNHLAHMLLTLKLLPLLAQGRDARVVTVSSGAQYMGKISWDDVQSKKQYERWRAYSQSKLANVMFGLELDDKLQKSNYEMASLIAHPGLARTNLQSNSLLANGSWQEELAYKLISPIFQSASMGALPQLFAATDPTAKSGEQYGPRFNFRGYPQLCKIAPLALKRLERGKLWDYSEKLLESFLV